VAVLLSVTAGTVLAGIVGALFAVPLVATLNTIILYYRGHDKFPELGFDDHIAIKPSGSPAYMVVSAAKYVSDGRWDEVPQSEDKGTEILDRIMARFQNKPDEPGSGSGPYETGDAGTQGGAGNAADSSAPSSTDSAGPNGEPRGQ
jgi:hypothetical protein